MSRELLFVDDLAKTCVHLINISQANYKKVTQPMLSHINIGTGEDITIKQLAQLVQKVVDFKGEIIWGKTKPDGTPRKLLNASKINQLGWQAQASL